MLLTLTYIYFNGHLWLETSDKMGNISFKVQINITIKIF